MLLLVCIKKTAIANSGIQLKFLRDSNNQKQLVSVISKFDEA